MFVMNFALVLFSSKLPVYLLIAPSCLSLFCYVYPWSLFNFTFCLFAIRICFQIIRAFNDRVKHVRVLVFLEQTNSAIALLFCVG